MSELSVATMNNEVNSTSNVEEGIEMDKIKICSVCGCVVEDPQELYEVEGDLMCEDCLLDEGYEICHDCGRAYKASSGYAIESYWDGGYEICPDCYESGDYFTCYECGYTHPNSDLWDYYRDKPICRSCSDNFTICADCGEVLRDNDNETYWDDYSEAYYCEECYENHSCKDIHDYGYKPNPTFYGLAGRPLSLSPLTFGVELEVDCGSNISDCASDLEYYNQGIYLKHDGSLSENGFEIVTHPATLDYHLANGGAINWSNITKTCLNYGFRSHDAGTCGLHVHVGRQQLGANDKERNIVIAKLTVLINRHWNKLFRFSRRRDSDIHWGDRPDFRPTGKYSERELIEFGSRTNRSRYVALNLYNYDTIEFRVFRGSLNLSTIRATLEFVSNLCLYAMNTSFKDCITSDFSDIVEYKHYQDLYDYCIERSVYLTPNDYEPLEIVEDDVHTGFIEGDKVKVTNAITGIDCTIPFLAGAIGTVVESCSSDSIMRGGRNILIDFYSIDNVDMIFRHPDAFHTGYGLLESNTGRWIHTDALERVV